MLKVLRLREAALRYTTGGDNVLYASAKADGLLEAVQIIDRLTNPKSGEE